MMLFRDLGPLALGDSIGHGTEFDVMLISNEASPSITVRDNHVETHVSWLSAVVVLTAELALLVTLVRLRQRRGVGMKACSQRRDPRQILKVRLASGEIDDVKYASLLRLLNE
jgi:hypothetical protein